MKWRRVIFPAFAIAGLFVWAACGDDDDAVVAAPDAGRDVQSDTFVQREASAVTFDEASTDDVVVAPLHEAGAHDAGPNDFQTFDGGDDLDGGIPCVQEGQLEIESNDTKATANAIDPPQSRCGVARVHFEDGGDGGDAGEVSESDFMTFTISPSAYNIFVQYHGDGVVVTVQAGDDGGVVDITQPNAVLDFKRNVPYFVEVRSKTGKNETWRVTVFEDN